MPIQTYLKVFWAFKARIGFMDQVETHSTPNVLLEGLQEVKDLKSLQELRLLAWAQILRVLWEFLLLFAESMDLSPREVRDFLWRVELELQENR